MIQTISSFVNELHGQVGPGGLTHLGWGMLIYFFVSWLICVSAAFCQVHEVRYHVGLIAVGGTLCITFLLGGLCRQFLPDLAASFTPGGLWVFCSLAGILICSVPLVQYFWDLSYWRGLVCVTGGIGILLVGFVLVQLMLHPMEQVPARLSVPLFQEARNGR